MAFTTEPTGYIKTSMSELQGSWSNLRDEVVKNLGFKDSEKLVFHIDEGMSWECVRDLEKMKSTLLLVLNISAQTDLPGEIEFWLGEVKEDLDHVLSEIAEGKVL